MKELYEEFGAKKKKLVALVGGTLVIFAVLANGTLSTQKISDVDTKQVSGISTAISGMDKAMEETIAELDAVSTTEITKTSGIEDAISGMDKAMEETIAELDMPNYDNYDGLDTLLTSEITPEQVKINMAAERKVDYNKYVVAVKKVLELDGISDRPIVDTLEIISERFESDLENVHVQNGMMDMMEYVDLENLENNSDTILNLIELSFNLSEQEYNSEISEYEDLKSAEFYEAVKAEVLIQKSLVEEAGFIVMPDEVASKKSNNRNI